ncbi:hypothetical protein GCM10011506_36700 [Marivirga lumbricoides]|uniref:STAS/SEC14 domain-containing protein n=1 Tax=Marivirga lumbricoides TaxID=1046115 RepID=A0A2T4DNB0_9BACT|nr:hypothetical protein C9994_11445 [Marivirga lumbricoides]GGC47761.1 hypothetical protein GCM10011506_36700 [Marivirga lumbricoides]
MEKLHKAKNIEIYYDKENGYMYCDWIGFQNKASIMESGKVILDFVKKNKYTKILNDNTKVTGPWQDAAEWTSTVWFPEMIKAGLQNFAWVFSSNIFAELSAKKAMPASDVIKSFLSVNDAKGWLIEQN